MNASRDQESPRGQTTHNAGMNEAFDATLTELPSSLSANSTSNEQIFSGQHPKLRSDFQLAIHLGAGYHSRGNEGRHRALGSR
jgi:hypothetical protein